MPTLTLSQLVAGRELAAEAVRKLGPVDGTHVVVDARPLVSGSTSFAAQLVRSALLDRHAAGLTILGGPAEFLADVKIAADQLQVTDHVAFAATDADLGVLS